MKLQLGLTPLLVTVALLAGLSSAWADDDALPPEQHQGDISYRSGGIGEDESSAMKAARSGYVLELLFASTEEGRAAYESGVHVSIRKADGSEVLEAVADGPYMLINLPAGKYKVVASARGEERKRDVAVVAGKHALASFQWKFSAPPAQ